MSTPRPLVVIINRGEHEAVLLGTSVLVGVGMLAVAPAPTSVLVLFPSWLVTVWALAWVVSGVAGLVGLWWPRLDVGRALAVERAALIINAAAVLLFTASAFVSAGWRAWAAGLFLAGWTVANLVRAFRIGREVKRLEQS